LNVSPRGHAGSQAREEEPGVVPGGHPSNTHAIDGGSRGPTQASGDQLFAFPSNTQARSPSIIVMRLPGA
jgi:hypothetical protein